MEPKTIAKFQIMGACIKTQTILWDDEIKLIDGLPYNINFYQDFSTMRLNGHLVIDMPVSSIIEFINSPNTKFSLYDVCNPATHSAKAYQCSQEFRETFNKFNKKEKKLARKWKKNKKKRAPVSKKVFSEIDSGEYFLKNRRK